MSSEESQFSIHFWGVRGSIACPGPGTVRYGGNTPCVEMLVGGRRLIFDGGTGLRVLGQHLLPEVPVEAHLFFTHTHWDHIQGFPFFMPAFVEGNRLHIYDALTSKNLTLEKCLTDQMRNPHFPVPLRVMEADLTFYDVEVGRPVELGGVTVDSAPLHHPGGAAGYRVNWRGHAAAYVTDTEHFPDHMDENVLALVHDADVMIYDAAYTDEEYRSIRWGKTGWGHSTWQEAVRIAKAANVKRLVVFHHDPNHDDDFLDSMGEQVAREFPESIMAREGLSIQLSLEPPVSDAGA